MWPTVAVKSRCCSRSRISGAPARAVVADSMYSSSSSSPMQRTKSTGPLSFAFDNTASAIVPLFIPVMRTSTIPFDAECETETPAPSSFLRSDSESSRA